ncbi:DUF2798 domain-containing protein [Sneathiella limimaris]|uniref:DUF2798 domain-containing protein n=1 Tax=Sneathiella limimaris TaxID=1964213 RepID=UPI00146BA50E|nr:DUF2798 domain-containing protein [Sneathiella limimaris]
MVPQRFEHILFGFILSGLMSFIVSGISTLRAIGWHDDFFLSWVGAWVPSWMVAFPVVLFVAPLTRRIVHKLVRPV